jgi:tetratricopeptide (TPR) repeat protein
MDHNVFNLSKRERVKIYLIVFVILYDINVLAANNNWIQETINYTINTDFNNALQIISKEIAADSNDYRAQFYLAATLNSKMTHFETQADADEFNKAIDKTLQLVESELETEKDLADSIKAELFFYEGSAYGYRAFFQGNNGNFLSAVTNGLKSVGLLNKALEIDSTVYGAYFGIGVYKYWRYSRLKFISWLPFIPDDREEGIAMIKLAVACDSLSRYIAMHQLVYILLDYGLFEEAISFAEKIVERYPNSQFMWWANAHAYYKNENFLKAKSSYLRLYSLIMADTNRNIAHLLNCKFKLAMVYKELGEFEACKNQCDSILEISEKIDLTESMKDIVSRTVELSDDCKNHLIIKVY